MVIRKQIRLSHDQQGLDTDRVISQLHRVYGENATINLKKIEVIDIPTGDSLGYFDIIL